MNAAEETSRAGDPAAGAPDADGAVAVPGPFEHWRLELDRESILHLDCDRAGESTNALSEAVLGELDRVLEWAERAPLAGLVLGSAKPASFVVGADVHEFDAYEDAEAVSAKIREGHRVLARLENLHCPTVAAVHGYCLGGGLELALACDWIVAKDVDATRFGFPEVRLGIFPGLGGTVRVTERLGGAKGLELALTGRMVRARAAKGMGLVDELVGEFASLRWAARRAALKKRRSKGPGRAASLTNSGAARAALGRVMARKTAEKADPRHYPAPFEMIDLWVEHRDNRRRMFEGEAVRVGELMVGDTARNLRRLFFLTERLKRLGKGSGFVARRVHVVGAGTMGGDIAAWCALRGLEVTLQDTSDERIRPALARAKRLFSKKLKGKPAVRAAESRLIADAAGEGAARADVVIEAIFEDADAKRALFAELEPVLRDGAILATNTSAIPLAELAKDLADPSRLVGLHFFNPVAKMPLVEVVRGESTDERWVEAACAFANAIDRFPLPVKGTPGFLVNRVLAPYLMQALTLLLEGIDKDTIDAAAIRWGMPMGPIELADTVGLDVCRHVAETLVDPDEDVEAQARLLDEKIAAGELGKKSAKGFYAWDGDDSDRRPVDVDNPYGERLAERLIRPLLDACAEASRDGVVEDDDLLDAGVVFGTGFAPFRGGPMQTLRDRERKTSGDRA